MAKIDTEEIKAMKDAIARSFKDMGVNAIQFEGSDEILLDGWLDHDRDKVSEVLGIIAAMYEIAIRGCSNHGCPYNQTRGGMKTNSICKCNYNIKQSIKQLEGKLHG